MTQPKRQYPTWMVHEDGTPDAEIAEKFDAERDELIKQIEIAFADVPMPKNGTIAIKYNSYSAFFGDMDGINRDFSGKRWQNISVELLARYSDHLKVFTHEGLSYFLPAMMCAIINYFENTQFLVDRIPEISTGNFYRLDTKNHNFSVNQVEVIYLFFEFMKNWWNMESDIQTDNEQVYRSIEFWRAELVRLQKATE